MKIKVIALGRIRAEKYYLYKALNKSTYHSLWSKCDLGLTRILKDWGYDAETEGCGINLQEVVVFLNFGHKSWVGLVHVLLNILHKWMHVYNETQKVVLLGEYPNFRPVILGWPCPCIIKHFTQMNACLQWDPKSGPSWWIS